MSRRNENASIAVPDDSRDRRLIIDLDINQNVDIHFFSLFSLAVCRWEILETQQPSRLIHKCNICMYVWLCVGYFSISKSAIVICPFLSPLSPQYLDWTIQSTTYVYIWLHFFVDWAYSVIVNNVELFSKGFQNSKLQWLLLKSVHLLRFFLGWNWI